MASTDRTVVEKLRRQQAALAKFGRFAFNESDLLTILTEAARICAASLDVRSARSADTVPLRTIFSSRPGVAGNSGSLVGSSRELTRHRHKDARIRLVSP